MALHGVGAALLLAVLGGASWAKEAPPHVERLGCRGVAISSHAQPLSRLLRGMADALSFELKYWASEDPPVTLALRGTPTEVMTRLPASMSVAVRYEADRRCPGQLRIVGVWVLPAGSAQAVPALAPAMAPKPLVPAPVASRDAPASARGGPPIERVTDEWREYMQLHGMQPEEDGNANPTR